MLVSPLILILNYEISFLCSVQSEKSLSFIFIKPHKVGPTTTPTPGMTNIEEESVWYCHFSVIMSIYNLNT